MHRLLAMGIAGLAAVSCGGGKASSTGCKTDQDCKGQRVCDQGACVDPGGAAADRGAAAAKAAAANPAPAADPSPAAPAAGDDPGTAPTAGGGGCAAAIAHLADVVRADPQPTVQFDPDKLLADCERKQATASHLACLMAAETVAATGACDAAEWRDVDVPTTVGRELAPGEQPDGPGALTVDGDYLVFRETSGRKCGFLYREHHFASAIFVMCGGGIISSPLTTTAEIEEVAALLRNQQQQEHEVVMSIMNNYPYGRAHRVYDQNGVYQGTRY